jgi:hypothetical protein
LKYFELTDSKGNWIGNAWNMVVPVSLPVARAGSTSVAEGHATTTKEI